MWEAFICSNDSANSPAAASSRDSAPRLGRSNRRSVGCLGNSHFAAALDRPHQPLRRLGMELSKPRSVLRPQRANLVEMDPGQSHRAFIWRWGSHHAGSRGRIPKDDRGRLAAARGRSLLVSDGDLDRPLAFGKNMGEAARLWLVLMPWPVWLAARFFVRDPSLAAPADAKQFSSRRAAALLLIQMAVCFGTVTRVTGFDFPTAPLR